MTHANKKLHSENTSNTSDNTNHNIAYRVADDIFIDPLAIGTTVEVRINSIEDFEAIPITVDLDFKTDILGAVLTHFNLIRL